MLAALLPVFVLLLADQPRAADSHQIAVSVPPEQTCPGPRQVTDALVARLPGVVLPNGQTPRPGMLRLAVATDPGGSIRLDLADPEGTPLLHRVLAVTRGPGECAALADTIALIIERYWREVGYDAPATPPPPPPNPPPPPAPAPPPTVRAAEPAPAPAPAAAVEARRAAQPPEVDHGGAGLRWSLAAALAGRAGDQSARDASAQVALSGEGRIGIRVSGGVSSATTAVAGARAVDSRRFPLRVGGYLPIRLGVGQLEPGLGVNADLMVFSIRNPNGVVAPNSPALCSGRLCATPSVDLALGWSFVSAHHVYVRALARGGASLYYSFETMDHDPIWRTPSTYLELALESGLWFP